MSLGRAIVTGMIGSYPVGGVAWDYGQYLVGLERLGFEVWYLEDTDWHSFDPTLGDYQEDWSYGVDFVARTLSSLSPTLAERWFIRDPRGEIHGADPSALAAVLGSADLFVNVSGGTVLREEYLGVPCKVLIDTDPGWNHFVNWPRWDSGAGVPNCGSWRDHDRFLTYAERIGAPDCLLPDMGLSWAPTRPPVLLDAWSAKPSPPPSAWTTVMSWRKHRQPMVHGGRSYGFKEMEFPLVADIPSRLGASFEVAVGDGAPTEIWQASGWTVTNSVGVSTTLDGYRSYIEQSRAELSVAKNVYVATRSGWTSCRSTCYLAAGRPVVVQDTGFSELLPTGGGLHAFSDTEEAIAGIELVESDYERESSMAREVAREHFATDVVLGDLLAVSARG